MADPLLKPDPYRPPIVLRRSDYKRLMDLALQRLLRAPRNAGALLQEIGRATVLDDGEIDDATVVIGSKVTFRSDTGEPPREVRLVLQSDPGGAPRHVSVLTNIGAGLLGLSRGQTIRWPDRVGGSRELTILDVQAPESTDATEENGPAACPRPQPEGADNVVPFRAKPRPAQADDDLPPSAA